MSNLKEEREKKKFFKKIDEKIKKVGYAIITVPMEDDKFATSYTVGLAEKGFGDIVINGPTQYMDHFGPLLSNIATDILDRKFKLCDGVTVSNDKVNYRLFEVSDPGVIQKYVSPIIIKRFGTNSTNGDGLKVYQVDIGNDLGQFAGDEGFSPMFPFVPLSDRLEDLYKAYL